MESNSIRYSPAVAENEISKSSSADTMACSILEGRGDAAWDSELGAPESFSRFCFQITFEQADSANAGVNARLKST